MVCVLPGRFPATMIVAPNSPMALAKLRIIPEISPVRARGTVTLMNVKSLPAPRVLAADS
ncbi:MAG: hypothetical protein BWY05_01377 [Euryarchaeota archaeon ADurb.Bin165]|nr:MAG: hypothetical protein BWY05_01377 [Euryarchaeota archaeon ADurb.Bin165]